MENEYGYIILEIGWEYNDEYYHTGNYGESYNKPNEVFLDKAKAEEELIKREIKSFKGQNIGMYFSDGDWADSLRVDEDEFIEFFKKEFNVNIDTDDWELPIPSNATDEQVEKIISMVDLNFHTLHKIKIN